MPIVHSSKIVGGPVGRALFTFKYFFQRAKGHADEDDPLLIMDIDGWMLGEKGINALNLGKLIINITD